MRYSESFGKNECAFDARAELPWLSKRFIVASLHMRTTFSFPTKTKHQRISGNLATAMITVSKQHKLGLVLTAPCDVVLSDENVVQPDLLFVATARAAIVTEDNIQGAPDLIVEILSESSRKKDEVTKRKLYERFGVQEYWIVDPELEIVKIFKLTQQGYGRASELSKETNDVLTTELLPGFDCAVSEIFE
ncbi:MAG: Uma2 family endonuclease [Deltaproteobacteria bacterium]|nr:Uma2 family endonuclease [Deltaproteobacteria bacterium]